MIKRGLWYQKHSRHVIQLYRCLAIKHDCGFTLCLCNQIFLQPKYAYLCINTYLMLTDLENGIYGISLAKQCWPTYDCGFWLFQCCLLLLLRYLPNTIIKTQQVLYINTKWNMLYASRSQAF